MNIIIIYLMMFLCVSCIASNHEKKEMALRDKMIIVDDVDDVLDKEIALKLKKYINSIVKYRVIDSTQVICYAIIFEKEKLNSMITEKDTAIIFSYYAYGLNYNGYKGVICFLDNYPVAIIDKYNIGSAFYKENDLIKIPLSEFKRVKDPVRPLGYLYKLEKGKLKNAMGGIYYPE